MVSRWFFGLSLLLLPLLVSAQSIPLAPPLPGATSQLAPVAASADGRALVVWKESSASAEWLRAAVVTEGGVLPPVTLMASRFVPEVSIAYGGGVYLIAWQNSSPETVHGIRVSLDGQVIDPAPITIGSLPWGSGWFSQTPGIAWNGQQFLVVWSGGPVYTTFVSPLGVAGPTRETDIVGETPAIAWNGERFVVAVTQVVFIGTISEALGWELYTATLKPDGTSNHDAKHITAGGRPSIATGGAEFFVAARSQENVFCTRLDHFGTLVGEPFAIVGEPLDYPRLWKSPATTWTGSAFAVAAHGKTVTYALHVSAFDRAKSTAVLTETVGSRPDQYAITSTALLTVGRATKVIFTDVTNDDYYAQHPRLMIDTVRSTFARRRAAH